MPDVVLIAGSPSASSKSSILLEYACQSLRRSGIHTHGISVRELPAEDLLHARSESTEVRSAIDIIEQTAGVIIATPVYKAAYSGLLKAFLDILPQYAFRDKTILPVVTGGSPGHQLALEYALKPVLGALGATDILRGLYVTEAQVQFGHGGSLSLEEGTERRFHSELEALARRLCRFPRGDEVAHTAAPTVHTPLNHAIDYPVRLDDYSI